jgi:hypothetical protein
MRLALLGLAVLAAFCLPAAASAAGQGGIGARLIAIPGGSRTDPLARLSILATLAPGATLSRRVEVSNTTNSAAAVTVYPAAASNVSGRGHLRVDARGDTYFFASTHIRGRYGCQNRSFERLTGGRLRQLSASSSPRNNICY